MPSFLDQFLFIVLPYIALLVFLLGTIFRYRKAPYSYSSLSSQFLENRRHFWALVPFHFGIITVLTGHVVAFLLPRQILEWNSRPVRLYILESAALMFGLMTAVGIIAAILRRITVSKVRQVTNQFDWIVLAMLLLQVVSGIYVAVFHPWGSAWFSAAVAPYLSSLIRFHPDLAFMTALPVGVKFHVVMAFSIIAVAPFTRLVHILVVPNPYLWRRPQVVRWYRAPGEAA